eukprot:1202622-Prymnesium_polylepis.1
MPMTRHGTAVAVATDTFSLPVALPSAPPLIESSRTMGGGGRAAVPSGHAPPGTIVSPPPSAASRPSSGSRGSSPPRIESSRTGGPGIGGASGPLSSTTCRGGSSRPSSWATIPRKSGAQPSTAMCSFHPKKI